MVRPRKCRDVRIRPLVRCFKPVGKAQAQEPVILREEELEALCMADRRGMEQAEAAAMMNISRSTFSRIVATARCAVATALVEGRAIRIEGGDYRVVTKNKNKKEDTQ